MTSCSLGRHPRPATNRTHWRFRNGRLEVQVEHVDHILIVETRPKSGDVIQYGRRRGRAIREDIHHLVKRLTRVLTVWLQLGWRQPRSTSRLSDGRLLERSRSQINLQAVDGLVVVVVIARISSSRLPGGAEY